MMRYLYCQKRPEWVYGFESGPCALPDVANEEAAISEARKCLETSKLKSTFTVVLYSQTDDGTVDGVCGWTKDKSGKVKDIPRDKLAGEFTVTKETFDNCWPKPGDMEAKRKLIEPTESPSRKS